MEINNPTNIVDYIKATGTGVTLRIDVQELGAWDMDTSGFVTVSLPVSRDKVRGFWAVVRNDAGTIYSLVPRRYAPSSEWDIYFGPMDSSDEVAIQRRGGGIFDDPAYSSTGINRGHFICMYED